MAGFEMRFVACERRCMEACLARFSKVGTQNPRISDLDLTYFQNVISMASLHNPPFTNQNAVMIPL